LVEDEEALKAMEEKITREKAEIHKKAEEQRRKIE
jgi:hypothetical protein